jgi:hypothetical protein
MRDLKRFIKEHPALDMGTLDLETGLDDDLPNSPSDRLSRTHPAPQNPDSPIFDISRYSLLTEELNTHRDTLETQIQKSYSDYLSYLSTLKIEIDHGLKSHTILLDNSNFYRGEWLDGRPHGAGKKWFTQQNKSFNGKFSEGEPVIGVGTWEYTDLGYRITGKFFGGNCEEVDGGGQYTIEYINGRFEGEEGFVGKHYRPCEEVKYVGKIRANGDLFVKEGYGKLNYRNGDVYTGEFRNGRRDGAGEYEFGKPDIKLQEWNESEGQATTRAGISLSLAKVAGDKPNADVKGKRDAYTKDKNSDDPSSNAKKYGLREIAFLHKYTGEFRNDLMEEENARLEFTNGDVFEGKVRQNR